MSDEELIARLRVDEPVCEEHFTANLAADRIEALTAKLATCEKYRDAYAECDRIGTQAVRDLEAKLAQATWLLTEAAVQLEEGKIKTRRNRAAIIWNLLDEMKDEIEGEKE